MRARAEGGTDELMSSNGPLVSFDRHGSSRLCLREVTVVPLSVAVISRHEGGQRNGRGSVVRIDHVDVLARGVVADDGDEMAAVPGPVDMAADGNPVVDLRLDVRKSQRPV